MYTIQTLKCTLYSLECTRSYMLDVRLQILLIIAVCTFAHLFLMFVFICLCKSSVKSVVWSLTAVGRNILWNLSV